MSQVYASHEAKARFSEILRKVRAGERIVLTYRGVEIAEIRPLPEAGGGLQARLQALVERGRIVSDRAKRVQVRWSDLVGEPRPGSLARFLVERGVE